MISAQEALERLQAGNKRFVEGLRDRRAQGIQQQRVDLLDGQEPFATILGCSDSRVPAELVFDQGLGDLFVIRVAGNIVAPSQVGSVEFAADTFGTPLVIVLGHSQCGAVQATIEHLHSPAKTSPNIQSIVKRIRPSVESLFETELKNKPDKLLRAAVRSNIRAAKNHLCHGSELLEQLIQQGKITVLGAEYSLETGEVDFFDDTVP